jgi:regulator of nonsense transcripts 1
VLVGSTSGGNVIKLCACRNIFGLGYIYSKTDNVSIMLCRSPCSTQPILKDKDWCSEEWTPIIKERQLLDCLARREPPAVSPPGTHTPSTRRAKASQIQQVEELWKVSTMQY